MIDLDRAIRLVGSISLPEGDYAIFGSGPLLAHRVIETVTDIDIIARGRAWSHGVATGELVYLEEHDVTVCSFLDGLVTMGRSWAYGGMDVDNLIDTAETIHGLPFVRLENVIEYKQIAGRPKDLDHLSRYAAWVARATYH